jgi:hypothetical protein
MDFLSKLKDKKNPGMSPAYKEAKMATLKDLHGAMSGMMKDDLAGAKGMKKVEVAGSSPEAVSAGLDKAKEMVGGSDDKDASSEIMDDGQSEAGDDTAASLIKELVDHEAAEGDLTADGIDELIKMLESKKMELSGGGDDASMSTPSFGKN